MIGTDWTQSPREQLLVVRDPGNLAGFLRGRYPAFRIAVNPTYLSGVAALAEHPARGLLVGVDPTARKLAGAIEGLRKAAGPEPPIVLCCRPSCEPLAREVLSHGANDYVVYPPRGDELDAALGLGSGGYVAGDLTPSASAPSWDELADLAGVLAGLDAGRKPLLERVCRLVAESMRTGAVHIICDQDRVHVGDPKIDPVLAEAITSAGRTIGQILVAPRQRSPFSAAEAEKLRHYGRLIGHLLGAAEQLQHWRELALIDPITQLPNRRYLLPALERLLRRARVEKLRVTVLMFDLDGFKHFNDAWGHDAGDEILRETSQLFRRCCRDHDIVARYAGDEFVVVFWDAEVPRVPGSKHPTDVLGLLRRFNKALESHEFRRLGASATGQITISGGLASYPWDAASGDELLACADRAMLEAKRAGKNRIYLVGSEGQPVDKDDMGVTPSGD